MWLGPAPLAPYRKNIHPIAWRGYFDYGGGNLADWGVQLLDIIQWAIQADHPLSVHTTGGKLWTNDDRAAPDTLNAVYEYPGAIVNYTHMNHCNYGRSCRFYGIIFHGSEAALLLDRSGYEIVPGTTKYIDPAGEAFRGAFDDMIGTGTYFVGAGWDRSSFGIRKRNASPITNRQTRCSPDITAHRGAWRASKYNDYVASSPNG